MLTSANIIALSKVTSETVVAAEFHPTEDGCIVTCGKGHVNFWQIDPSYSSVSRRTGVLELIRADYWS